MADQDQAQVSKVKEFQRPLSTTRTTKMMAHFIKHSYSHGSEEDRKLSHFLMKNLLKGVLITNSLLVMFYVSRFRTYRNSYLAMMHIPATLIGLYNAIMGTHAIFFAYLFNSAEVNQRYALRDLQVPGTAAEQAFFKGRLTQNEKTVLNEVLSHAYTGDLFQRNNQ